MSACVCVCGCVGVVGGWVGAFAFFTNPFVHNGDLGTRLAFLFCHVDLN